MPYTPEELKDMTWYQDFISADEERYLQNKQVLLERAALSGSADDGSSFLARDSENIILLFEDPYKNEILEDPTSKIIYNTEVKRLKTKEGDFMVTSIIDRTFREL